jgi:hypothetical protein
LGSKGISRAIYIRIDLVKGSIERGIEFRKRFRLKKWQVSGQGLEQSFWDKTYGIKNFQVVMVDG